MGPAPQVHLLDDHQDTLDATAIFLSAAGYQVLRYESPEEFLSAREFRSPECLILDLVLPRISGLEVQRRLLQRGAAIPVIMLTGHGSIPAAVQALKLGAEDFLQKPCDSSILLDAVGTAIEKDRQREEARVAGARARDLVRRLSAREGQVFDLLVEGLTSKGIAMRMGIAKKTVDIHRSRVMKKLEAESIADLIKLAVVLAGEGGLGCAVASPQAMATQVH